MNNTVSELITALDEEITALKQGRGGSVTKVFNGKFIRQVPNGFVYIFHLENFLATLDDTPADIEINKQQYPAQVLSTNGLEVQICIENFCGDYIAEAKLHTNLWYLLELLRKKFLESGDKFNLSDALFSGDISKFPENSYSGEMSFSPSVRIPNTAQQKAIESSFCKSLNIIWGPPGTGKTTTIAKAIESHINAGRRVLLVSHANNAVDQALIDIAEQMKVTPYYENGELVRLGIPTDQVIYNELEDKYEMVLIDKIANKLGVSLVKEKNELIEKKNKIELKIADINTAITLIEETKTLIKNKKDTEDAIRKYDILINKNNKKNNIKYFFIYLIKYLFLYQT